MKVRYLVWSTLSVAVTATGFNWAAITPHENLQYHACYDGFQCARLTVPLDWLDANNTKTVALAIATIPAKVPSHDPSFGGTIIINPGGPGSSGIDAVGAYGRRLQAMTGGEKHYEILGFDPRGVAYTTPKANCFGGGHVLARDSMELESRGIGGMDTSLHGLGRYLALIEAFGSLCETRDAEDDIMKYVTTASVARDIVEIADRVDELRYNKHAVPQGSTQHPMESGNEISERSPARVMYWGFSYGTIVGNTLASMFPGRMARVVLDGVDDAYDYYSGSWLGNLLDTDKIADYFYDTCFDGADMCPLWKKGDASGKDIKNRIDRLVSNADANPLSVTQTDGSYNIEVVTGNDILNSFRLPFYHPLPNGFENLAKTLAQALEGNYTSIVQGLHLPSLQDACSIDNSTVAGVDDATTAILCSDADFADPDGPYHGGKRQGVPFWRDYVQNLKNQSSVFGFWWSEIASKCSGWRTRPKWRFAGPFTTPPADPSLREGVPAAPILLTSTRLDPVTPLRNAYAMSSGHPGSAVLIHETVGHCAMRSGWSDCFNQAIRAYFDNGTVPENGTVCDTTCKPFSKDGKCQPPAEVVAAKGDASLFGFADNNRAGWGFRPLGMH